MVNREHSKSEWAGGGGGGGVTGQFISGELGNRLPAYCSNQSKTKKGYMYVKISLSYHAHLKVNVIFLITQCA